MLKAKLLIGVFDFPAKVSALNVVQYNRYYGWPYCTDKGVQSSHRHLYLPSEPHHLRVQSDINKWAHEAFLLGTSKLVSKNVIVVSVLVNTSNTNGLHACNSSRDCKSLLMLLVKSLLF